MRLLVPTLAALALAACVTADDDRFHVGRAERAYVIIGAAEAADNSEARYSMLWRRLNDAGAFSEHEGRNSFEAETNSGDTLRVRGIPGEFTLREIDPGVYALDSVFGVIPDGRVDYIADGIVQGPERPAFRVGAGEAVYLGIWQVRLEGAVAVSRLWRLEERDLRAVLNSSNDIVGPVRMHETETRSVSCEPRRMNSRTRRMIC